MQFGVLGPLLVQDGAAAVVVSAPRQRVLLAALLLRPNEVVAVDELAELMGEGTPRPTVVNYMMRLRRALGEQVAARIVTAPPGYLIEVREGELDLWQALELQERARTETAERARELLRQALALWRGRPLLDVPSDALQRDEGGRLAELRLLLLAERLEADLRAGHAAEVVGELQQLVLAQPLSERFQAQLMRALRQSGRRSEALAVYDRARRALAEELGVDPGAELRRLHQQLLSAEEAPVRPGQLPAGPTGFVGRATLLRELDGLSRRGVVVLAGPAGVGKSALAVRWAWQARQDFPDGQLHVAFTGSAEPIGALARFLRALGVPADLLPAEVEEAAGMYRSLLADRRTLVILDNAASAEQVRPLLPGGAGNLVLVTSRDRLSGLIARDGAVRLELAVLEQEEARTLLAGIIGERRVQDEPAPAAELAELCGRLPLALRIAAAHLADQPERKIGDYVAELRGGDLLAALEIDGDEQASVRAAFAVSHRRLADPQRRLFRLLALVPGPDFTAGAAAALLDARPQEASRLLDGLVGAHLLDRSPSGRYAFHDLVGLYARSQPGEPGDAEARERLLRWYAGSADAAARALFPTALRSGPPYGKHAVPGFLDDELANLRAAAESDGPTAVLLAEALSQYFWLRRDKVDAFPVYDAAMRAAPDPRAEVLIRVGLARASALCPGHAAQAVRQAERAEALAAGIDWPEGRAHALNTLGYVAVHVGDLDKARQLYGVALDASDDPASVPGLLANLGSVELRGGRLAESLAHLEDALARARDAGVPALEASCLNRLAVARFYLDDHEGARRDADTALELNARAGRADGEAMSLAILSRLAGTPEEAWEYASRAAARGGESGEPFTATVVRNVLAAAHYRLGEYGEAEALYRDVLASGGLYQQVEARIGLAEVYAALGEHGRAAEQAEEARRSSRAAGFRLFEREALDLLARGH
ncbi:ATP-binding protein [Nonomuraea sp. NPDC050556]|uniref:ATP-binding protein n=1 Tax=Nonomuraea sp. NPDC050556 TaxID=3364369 RepID=UPI00379040BD